MAEFDANCGFQADCLAVSDDGEHLACIGGDGDKCSVSVYSSSSQCVLSSMQGHTDVVSSVALQGNLVVSAARDKTIRLWSLVTGECSGVLHGSNEIVYGLALRGDLLFSGEGGKGRARARLWSISRAEVLAVMQRHTGAIWGTALSADLALSASNDKCARVWLTDGRAGCLAKLGHPEAVFSVSIDGDLVATGCGDSKVRLWSLASFQCLRTFEHRGGANVGVNSFLNNPVHSVRLSGGVLLSGGLEQTIKLWSLAPGGSCVATLTHGGTVTGLAISRQGGFVASSGGKLKKLVLWSGKG